MCGWCFLVCYQEKLYNLYLLIFCFEWERSKKMNLQQAKERIKELNDFIELVSNYKVTSLETAAIYEYALENNVSKVASKLNEKGYRAQGVKGPRILSSNDVSEILKGKEIDELHAIIKSMFEKNKRKVRKFT